MRAFLVLIALVCAQPALAQDDFADVKIKAQKLTDKIQVLFGAGGNIGVFVGETRTLMIDDQFAPLGPRIEAAIMGLKSQPIGFLINTHWHGDHSGGNVYFGEAGALIIAHDNVHRRLSTPQVSGFDGSKIKPIAKAGHPVLTYSATSTVHEDDETIRLIHVENAHTDGDTLVHFTEEDVIHMGDVFFYGRFPYIDLASGGSLDGMVRALGYAASMIGDKTQVIPGHGAVTDRTGIQATQAMLADISAKAKAVAAAGGDEGIFLASQPAADYPDILKASGEQWTKRFLGIAFKSVTAP